MANLARTERSVGVSTYVYTETESAFNSSQTDLGRLVPQTGHVSRTKQFFNWCTEWPVVLYINTHSANLQVFLSFINFEITSQNKDTYDMKEVHSLSFYLAFPITLFRYDLQNKKVSCFSHKRYLCWRYLTSEGMRAWI